MEETTRTVQVKAYMDDEGKPVCNFTCEKLIWDRFGCKFSTYKKGERSGPGPTCPVWYGESKGEWQPISTAPVDGTEILGVNNDNIRCVIRYGKHNHIPIYGWIRQVELYGEEVDGFTPVAWFDLPSPPQEKQP